MRRYWLADVLPLHLTPAETKAFSENEQKIRWPIVKEFSQRQLIIEVDPA